VPTREEKKKISSKRWRDEHKIERAIYDKKFRDEDPLRYWCISSLTVHKRKGCDINITWQELKEIVKRAKFCSYCEEELDWNRKGTVYSKSPTIDRIYNERKIDQESIRIVCLRCNLIKGNEIGTKLKARLKKLIENVPE